MAWCPKCDVEYKDGIEICSECHSKLIQNPKHLFPVYMGAEEEMNRIADFLKYNDIKCEVIDMLDGNYSIFTDKRNVQMAQKVISVFLSQESIKQEFEEAIDTKSIQDADETDENNDELSSEMEDELEEISEEILKDSTAPYKAVVFKSKADKAKDYLGSAYTLFLVSALAAILLVLIQFEVLPFEFANPILMYFVFSAMIIAFIVLGVSSLKNGRQYQKDAPREVEEIESLKKWYQENLDEETINKVISATEDEEDSIYYARIDYMKKQAKEAFPDTADALLDYVTDDYYGVLFTDKDN